MVTGARPAGAARALLRDRRRGRQHPHRRGADAADHQRPGRGIGGPVLHVRPARAPPARAGRRATRRAATTSSTSRTRPSRPPKRASTRSRAGSASRTCTTPTRRLARHFEQALKAHALYKRDRDYIVKDGEIVIVDEFTGRQMPGRRWSEGLHQAIEAKEGLRVQRESRDPRHDHVPELLPALRQAGRHDRYGHDRGRGVPQDLQPRGGRHPDPPRDDPRRRRGPRLPQRERRSSTPSSTRSSRCTETGRPVLVGTVVGREVRDPLGDAQAPRHQARGAERQVPREGIRDRRPGRPDRAR